MGGYPFIAGWFRENPNLKWMMTGGTPNLWKPPDGDFPGRHLLNCQGPEVDPELTAANLVPKFQIFP